MVTSIDDGERCGLRRHVRQSTVKSGRERKHVYHVCQNITLGQVKSALSLRVLSQL